MASSCCGSRAENAGMRLFRTLIRLLMVVAGAFLGLALFLFGLLTFVVILVFSLVTGRKPGLQFRMNPRPWARHRPPRGDDDVVDIEVREVPEAAPLPLAKPDPRSGS
ncbi:hypothetical protein DBR42_19110 [Pelomonas sp. HMWF004]|nr:hypothetical protein DBR42_19110 [Pelomonas sp. HMWF004]